MKYFEVGSWRRRIGIVIATLLQATLTSGAQALEFDTGNPDIKLRWDNTVKYSAGYRIRSADSILIDDELAANRNNINLDDGDRNFRNRGLISNRYDLLSELDFNYENRFGIRTSGAAWYDSVYMRGDENNTPGRVNQVSEPPNQFPADTTGLVGRRAEFLDGFGFANDTIAGMPANLRVGYHTLLYGETLFFGSNGIAYAQAPIDLIKLLAVPSSQFKEIILPVNQASGQIQVQDDLTFGGYYQFDWRESRIPPVGSYFSSVDVLGNGAERFLFVPGLGAPRTGDIAGKDSGQYGLQIRWRPRALDAEFGFYAVEYNDKLPQAYLRPLGLPAPFGLGPPFPLNFQLVYPDRIRSYGTSFSTTVADWNVAGEFSLRRNTPLVSGPQVDPSPGGSGGVGANALYAVGNSAHFNLSGIYLLRPNLIWQGGSFLGEIGWNDRTQITKNPGALDPNTSRTAWGLRFILEPSWFQILPQLDVSAPLGVGYNPHGNSSVVQQFNGGVARGGDASIGIKATYRQVWRFSLAYTMFYGPAGPALGADAHLTFKQSLADRDFVAFSVQTSF